MFKSVYKCYKYYELHFLHNQPGKVIFPKFMKEIPNLGMRRDNTVGSLIIEFDVEEPPMLPPQIVEYLSNNL